jgi:hypothetical protein
MGLLDSFIKTIPDVSDYDNGVYRFRYRGHQMCEELSKFRKDNPDKKIISVVYEPTNEYHGSFIIITDKKEI